MKNPLEIEVSLDADIGKRLLSDIGATSVPTKARKIQLTDETSRVHVVVIQPGQSSPSDVVTIRFAMDMSSMVVKNGFTTNVIRPFVPLLVELGIAAARSRMTKLTVQALQSIDDDEFRIVRVSGSYLFDFKSGTAALDAHCRLFKHLKVRLDCADRYPAGRRAHNALSPRVFSLPVPRHAFAVELVHYPFREPFGEARSSLAKDVWDMPGKLATGEDSREHLFDRVSQLLRVDVTVTTESRLPSSDGGTLVLPSKFSSLAETQENPFEGIWTAFTWAAWFNEDFANESSDFGSGSLTALDKELLGIYLQGDSLLDHYFVRKRPEMLLEVRRLLLTRAGVDILVPWQAAKLCEATWLRPRLEYSTRLDPSKDPLLAPYCLTPASAEEVVAKLTKALPTAVSR